MSAPTRMQSSSHSRQPKIVTALIEMFGFSPLLASIVAFFLFLLGAAAVLWVMLSAPPRVVTIVSGPAGSSFQRYAEAYRDELAKHGVTVNIQPSGGSEDNLTRLKAPGSHVDIGFVQGGLVGEKAPPGLVSLGTVSCQPLWVFYRGQTRMTRLSELAGKRLGIGDPGSGVHTLAHALLDLNGVTGAPTTFDEQPAETAAKDFQAGKLDAIFLMGDSAPLQTLRTLIRAPDIQAFDFIQADAYVRRVSYLNKIILPQGSIDFGHNLPPHDVALVGPGVELIAREKLDSAISDLLLGAAQKVNGRPGLLARPGEFPKPLEREYPMSEDALRYYKSGKPLTYKLVNSFWLASLINRVLVAIVPIFLVLIPMTRLLPIIYRWSVQLRIYRHYRPLLRVERDAAVPLVPDRASELLGRLDTIERDVNALRVPASFASQYYDLRNHVAFVRQRLQSSIAT